jgi:antitoxin component of MazEF toxin-antitoxin module
MKKKLVRHGNSMALVIDKPLLSLLGLSKDGSTVKITVVNNKLLVEAAPKKESFKTIVKNIIKENKPVLKKLAKT